jgi:hypothetical protein
MPSFNMTSPDVLEFRPSLVLELRDGFTDSNVLQGNVDVTIGKNSPLFRKDPEATFVFANLPNGSYTLKVTSTPDQPYYLPAAIPITVPLPVLSDTTWPQPWTGYPNVTLADPALTLDDPAQSAAYLAQRELASLQPTTSYPFPSGTTLVRGQVTAAGAPVSGAFVTLALLAQPGQFPVTVVNPDGAVSASKTLSVVTTPVIESLSPAVVIAGSPAFLLTVEGTGFVSGATIRFAGVALATTFLGGAVLSAEIPGAAIANAGQFSVTVTNPDGTLSNQQNLVVAAAPAVNSINPPSVSAGSAAFSLAVQGSGFAAKAAVRIQGAAVKTKFINSTELSASVSAAQIAVAAQLSVVVATPGPPQQLSNPHTLSVVSAPVISACEPSTVIAGSADFTLVVLGTGYVAGSIVKLNGVALPTTYGSSTELSATVAAAQVAAAGVLNIAVTNPNGTTSAAQTLTVAVGPSITSIDPVSVTAGSTAFTLVVHGTGFISGSVVELNGTQLATTFVSDSQLDAHVPRSGYTTGADGTFVLFFDQAEFDAITGRSQTVTLIVTQQGNPKQTLEDVTVLRGATVSVDIDIT